MRRKILEIRRAFENYAWSLFTKVNRGALSSLLLNAMIRVRFVSLSHDSEMDAFLDAFRT